ncbi:YjfA family protein [Streptomyces sp. NPDC057027]|uniref:YjfA family protein n=1 Tax=Streptomyces sp. NPDC057027 TaxID=3346004 RepID=UPI0036408541
MSTRRPAVALAAVLITAAATASAVSAPAQATPDVAETPAKALATCFATTCHGLDPIETHCVDDAVTIDDVVLDGRIVRLRYSAQCRAAWAQLWYGKPGDRAYVRTVENGQTVAVNSITVMPWSGTSVYTPMVNDKDLKATACTEFDYLPDDTGTKCTIFY